MSPSKFDSKAKGTAQMLQPARLIMVMGVSGSGKSTIGSALGVALNVPFLDGDHYHSPEAVEKMRQGTPLTDADRWPWFSRLTGAMKEAADQRAQSVTACSALKRAYRDYLRKAADEPILFVYLAGGKDLIATRQANRPGHFMPPTLLDSQFETLEAPEADENVMTVSVGSTVEGIVAEILATLKTL